MAMRQAVSYIPYATYPGTSRNYTENIEYDCKLTYGTCASFGSLYSFCVNVYGRSYFTGTNNQIIDERRR